MKPPKPRAAAPSNPMNDMLAQIQNRGKGPALNSAADRPPVEKPADAQGDMLAAIRGKGLAGLTHVGSNPGASRDPEPTTPAVCPDPHKGPCPVCGKSALEIRILEIAKVNGNDSDGSDSSESDWSDSDDD